MKNSYIWITTQKAGFHYYNTPPKKVGFLKSIHRHLFKFKIYIEVFHNERDVEFFMFKEFIDKAINKIWGKHMMSNMYCNAISCETIAQELYDIIDIKRIYKNRNIIIEISEDGENGIRKEWIK